MDDLCPDPRPRRELTPRPNLSAERLAELRLWVRDGLYDAPHVREEVARKLLSSRCLQEPGSTDG